MVPTQVLLVHTMNGLTVNLFFESRQRTGIFISCSVAMSQLYLCELDGVNMEIDRWSAV